MRIDVLTIFPEMFSPVLGSSILKRAIAKGRVRVSVHDLRRWSQDRHKKVDDRPYGGGPGMLMRPEPFFDAVEELKESGVRSRESGVGTPCPHIVLLSPQGKRLTQPLVKQLAQRPWLILLCGHYEGVDERVRVGLADEEISIGDYVLTCGEIPAMVLIDSVVRLLPGVLGSERSTEEESFHGDLLEYPQFTRRVEIRGMRVPEILRSGDHVQIRQWRRLQALRRTFARERQL